VAHPLALTGERTLPGVAGEEYWFARHEAAYRWVATTYADRIAGSVVVEAGSGEGYGADLLSAAGARVVVALEYDESAATHSATAYADVVTTRANLAAIPLAPGSADVLVSLQVVEHLWDLTGFLRDARTVLRPGGLTILSTPNRPVFSPGLGRGERPTNPFHVEELDAEQLADLLTEAGFVEVVVLGLHQGPRLLAWESRQGTSLVSAQVASALSGTSDPSLASFVATVTADDFVLGTSDDAHDLVATAVRP
jgi:SAM-dependent methyltransferase